MVILPLFPFSFRRYCCRSRDCLIVDLYRGNLVHLWKWCFRVANETGQVLLLLSLIAIGREIGKEMQVSCRCGRVEDEKVDVLQDVRHGLDTGVNSEDYNGVVCHTSR